MDPQSIGQNCERLYFYIRSMILVMSRLKIHPILRTNNAYERREALVSNSNEVISFVVNTCEILLFSSEQARRTNIQSFALSHLMTFISRRSILKTFSSGVSQLAFVSVPLLPHPLPLPDLFDCPHHLQTNSLTHLLHFHLHHRMFDIASTHPRMAILLEAKRNDH
mmetsp:Transcript_28108/g.41820  ORF Transcript_28108/g.41820 Transcript_28108/m.41820 type:complete len:166 (-) Transcript_28108:367-864(-)